MKKGIPQTAILATALLLSSCSLNNEKTHEPKGTSTVESNQQKMLPDQTEEPENTSTTFKLTLDDFKGIPEDVEGCACYFSETDMKFDNKEYLFAAGFDSVGFVSVNNELIKLKLNSTGRAPDTFGDHDHIDVYKSERYKVTVDIKYKYSNGDETWWNDGTVTIESNEGEKVTKKFVGECGC